MLLVDPQEKAAVKTCKKKRKLKLKGSKRISPIINGECQQLTLESKKEKVKKKKRKSTKVADADVGSQNKTKKCRREGEAMDSTSAENKKISDKKPLKSRFERRNIR